MKRPSCGAVLLAGGASRRMGFPKALVEIGGKPLWKMQAKKLQALRPDELLVSAPSGLEFPSGPWKVVRDARPGLGPLGGVAAARQAMSSEWLIVLAVDMPGMTVPYLQNLRDRAFAAGAGIVPEMDGYYLGVAAIYPRGCLENLEVFLEQEDRSFQRLAREGIAARALVAQPVSADERSLFRNVNSRADLSPPIRH